MILDFQDSQKLNAKKFDFVKYAYILNHFQKQMSANEINFYFNSIFSCSHSNVHRIGQIMKRYKEIFEIIEADSWQNPFKTYSFSGQIKLHPSTDLLWRQKFERFMRTK